MPRIDETIKSAILEATKEHGSQAKLADSVGITPASLSRYLNGSVKAINAATWNMIYPAIEKYLPEEYHRKFLSWKTPEQWDELSKQYPDMVNYFKKSTEDYDIAGNAHKEPRFGKIEDVVNLWKVIEDKLPYGHKKTLNTILRLLLDDEEKAREIENRAKGSENIENHDS